jgi:hypothetical protein
MRQTNVYLMQGTTIISTVMLLHDLLKASAKHPEFTRLPYSHQQAARTILTEELRFQREQLEKMLKMVAS